MGPNRSRSKQPEKDISIDRSWGVGKILKKTDTVVRANLKTKGTHSLSYLKYLSFSG